MEIPDPEMTLGSLPVGSRLLIRSKTDWRFAAIARTIDERVVITVASPTGCNYRLRRDRSALVTVEGSIAILCGEYSDTWRENFGRYDVRW